MVLVGQCELKKFLDDAIKLPDCEEKTRSYIIDIFASISLERDFTNESVTFALKDAYDSMSFKGFKELGDWLFFTKSMFPKSLKGADPTYYDSIARTSYYRCFMLLNKEWLLYEELADQFPTYTQMINRSLGRATSENWLHFATSENGFFKFNSY
jgi:hypothetical protein